jgi:hypothetical protein
MWSIYMLYMCILDSRKDKIGYVIRVTSVEVYNENVFDILDMQGKGKGGKEGT